MEKFREGRLDYFRIETDPQNMRRESTLVQSLNEERRKAPEKGDGKSKPKKQWRTEQTAKKKWVKKAPTK